MLKKTFFFLTFACYLCLTTWWLTAQSVKPANIVFSPPRYYLGDLVTLQFKLANSDAQQLHIPIYPLSETLKVEQISIDQKANDVFVTVKFRAYALGDQPISLNLGSVMIEPINYHVSSLIEESGRELRGSYGPQLLVGTRLMIASLIILLILLPPLLFFTTYATKNLIVVIRRYIQSPYRKFNHEISHLYRDPTLSDKVFYFTLLESFRNFLSLSSGIKEYRSATEQHLSELLRLCFTKEETDAIIALYKGADLVKFGGNRATAGQRISDIDLISRLAKNFYKNGGLQHSSL